MPDNEKTVLVQFIRHVAGPAHLPHRLPGQRAWLTPKQIRDQKLTHGVDFVTATEADARDRRKRKKQARDEKSDERRDKRQSKRDARKSR